jgi:hypothetical protein
MDRNVMAKILHMHEGRFAQVDDKLASLFKVLQEIIGKELIRGQALHKVLMDKKIFTDEELTVALKSLMDEAKADLEKAKQEVVEQKQKAIEILIPAGANVNPPTAPEAPSFVEGPIVHPDMLAAIQKEQEAPSAEPPTSNG